MPSVNTSVPHGLSRDEALQRLRGFIEQVREQYRDQVGQVEERWVENVLHFGLRPFGFKVEGSLTVDDEHARVDASVPLAALAFRGRIERSIQDALRTAFA